MHNNGEISNTLVPKGLSRNVKNSQKEMKEGDLADQRIYQLSLNPEGDTREEQLNFNMPTIDETLRKEFPGTYGNGSFISLCSKIHEIRGYAQSGSKLANIIAHTKSSLKLIELVTRTPSLSNEDIDEELRRPEKSKQFTGKTHEELKRIVQEIRVMNEAKYSLARIVQGSKASIRLIDLAMREPKLSIEQIDQEIHTSSAVTQQQESDARLMPVKLMEKVKAIKASAKLKSLSGVLGETKASLTLIELTLKDETITSDEKLQQALMAGVPPFDASTLDSKKIQDIRKLETRKISFPKIVEQFKVPLRCVAIVTAKKLPTAEVYSYSVDEIKQEMLKLQLGAKIEELKLDPKEFSKRISQVRELILDSRHPFAIQRQLNVSFELIELVGKEQLAFDKMQPKLSDKRAKQDPDFTGLPFSELKSQVEAIRKGFREDKSIGHIMSETKSTIRLIELALRNNVSLSLIEIDQEIRNPDPAPDPDFNGMSYKAIRGLVRSIREERYKQSLPLPIIPPVITTRPPRRPPMPELGPVELKVISTPKLGDWLYSSTIRMDQTFEAARRQAAPLNLIPRFKLFDAVELETHFKQMTKNNREPEALELYLFFKPLFESETVDGQCTALLLLHSRQEKRIRQLILTILRGVNKPNRERAIARFYDHDPTTNFTDQLEADLHRKEKNSKQIRDFILAHYTIFEKNYGKLSLTQYGFKKLIVIFQLFKIKLDELDRTASGPNPSPTLIHLRQLCGSTKQAKQAKILLDIFINSRKGLISGEITPSEADEIIYWLLKEGYCLSFVERYCLESKTETLVHEIFFSLLQDEQKSFERRLNHPSIKTMSSIFAAKHFGKHKNKDILVDATLSRQELNLSHVIRMVFSDDFPLLPCTPQPSPPSSRISERERKRGSGDVESTKFLARPVHRSEEQISILSTSSKPPITFIALALYFLNLKNEFIASPEKIRNSLTWMLNNDFDKFLRFVYSLLEAPIFDPRYLDRREKLLAEIATVLALVQNKLLPDFLAEGFAKNLTVDEDKDQFIVDFLQAADHVFTMDILSCGFAYDPKIRNAKLTVCRLLTELIGADAQLLQLTTKPAGDLREIDSLETFINKTICDLSAVCEMNHMYHLLPLRFNLELSKMTILKCVFAFPFHFTTLEDNDDFSSLQAPNVPFTDDTSSKRLEFWKEHRKNIFKKIFTDALTDISDAEKSNFYKFFYHFCNQFSDSLLEEIRTWCRVQGERSGGFTDPREFLQLIEELNQSSRLNPDNGEETEGTLVLPSFPEASGENNHELKPLQLWPKVSRGEPHILSHLVPERVRTEKFVPLKGAVMQGLVNLINALKEENRRKSSKLGLETSFKRELCKVLDRLISSQTSCWYFLEIMNSADLMEEFATLIESKPHPDEEVLSEITEIPDDPSSLKSVFLRTFQAFDSLRPRYNYSLPFVHQVALFNFGLHYLGTGNLSPYEQDAVATWLVRSWKNRDDLRKKNIPGYLLEFIQLLVKWWPYQSPDNEYFRYLEKFTKAADSIPLFKTIIATMGVFLLTKTEDLEFDFILLTPTIELFEKAYIALSQELKPDAIINFLEVLRHHFERIDNFLGKIYLNEHHQHCPQFTDRLVALRGSIITIFIEINKAIKFNPSKNIKNELAVEKSDLHPISKQTRVLLIASPSELQKKILLLTTRALRNNRFATQFITALMEQDQDDHQSSEVDFARTRNIVIDDATPSALEIKSKVRELGVNGHVDEDQSKIAAALIVNLKDIHPQILTACLHTLIRQCRHTPHNLLPLNYLEKIKYLVSNYLKNILFHGAKNAEEAMQLLKFKAWPSYLNILNNQKKANNWQDITSSNWFPQLDVYQYVCNLLGMPAHEDERQIANTIETMSYRRLREEIIFGYVQEGVKSAFFSLTCPISIPSLGSMVPSSIQKGTNEQDAQPIAIDLEDISIPREEDSPYKRLKARLDSSRQKSDDDKEASSYATIANQETISVPGSDEEDETKSEAKILADIEGPSESAGREKQYNSYLRQLMIGFLQKIEDQVLKFIAIKGNGFTALLETEYTAFLKAVMLYTPNTREFNYFCNEHNPFLFLKILYILKDALVIKLDTSDFESLRKILVFYEPSPLFKSQPIFVNKCLEFLDRYFSSEEEKSKEHKGLGNIRILNPDLSAAETAGRPSRLSALAAIGSIGCPINFQDYQNIQSQLAHLNKELEERQKVVQLSQNRSAWSAEIEAVLGRPPESIEYISQIIIRIFSALGESCPAFLASSHQPDFSEQITQLFARARQGLESQSNKSGVKPAIKDQLDELLKLVSEGDDDDSGKEIWIQSSEPLKVYLMQAAVLMKVAQAFNNYKVHSSVAKAAVLGFQAPVESLLSNSPLDLGLGGKNSNDRYQQWHTCYQMMLYLAKIIVIGEIKRLGLYDSTQSTIRKQLSLYKQYQQMLEAPFGYEDSNNSQLNIVLILLSDASLTFEPEGQKAPDWLNKFLEQWNLLLFPIIYTPTESNDLELIANLGSEIEVNLRAESKTFSPSSIEPKEEEIKAEQEPLILIIKPNDNDGRKKAKQLTYPLPSTAESKELSSFSTVTTEKKENKYEQKREQKIPIIDPSDDDQDEKKELLRKGIAPVETSLPKELTPLSPTPTLCGLWLKIISSHPQLENSGWLKKIESNRSIMDGPYQAYFAGETLRILFAIIRNQSNKFRGYCLIEGLQQVFDHFKVEEDQPFADLFAKMKFRLAAFRAQYPFDIEEVIFSGIYAGFSYDIETDIADETLLTNKADQDTVELLIKTFLTPSNFFEGEKGEHARKIMREFIGLTDLLRDTVTRDKVKIQIFKTVLKLLFDEKIESNIDRFIGFLERNALSNRPIVRVEKTLFALLGQISQLHDSENPQLISSFIDRIESQLIYAFLEPHEDEDGSESQTILRELEIYCHARDIHKQLKSSTDWTQLDEKSIQRRITDFWLAPSCLMAARIMHVLGIKVLSNSQCRFLFKTRSKPEILESIISSFDIIGSMKISEWITSRQPPLVNVFNSLLLKLLGQKIGDELTGYVEKVSTKISEKSIDVRALFEFILCACILKTPCVGFSYKKETATTVLLQLAGYLVLTKNQAEQSAVFRIALDLIGIMKKENLLGIADVGLFESLMGTNEYDLLRAYIENRQAITTASSHLEDADRYQVLYLYSFIAEKIDNYTYQSKQPLANIPALTAGVKEWHKKIKTKIKEIPEEAEAKPSRNLLLNHLLREAGKMLQLAQQYPTVVKDDLGTKSQFVSGLLKPVNQRISRETSELKGGYQFSEILKSKTVKNDLMELYRIREILFKENPSFPNSVSPEIFNEFKASISGLEPMGIWTETCWFFFYCKYEERVEFEQLALAWLSSTAPSKLVTDGYLKLNCVLNYIEGHVQKNYEGGPISNYTLLCKFLEMRQLVNQTAPKGSPINQLYVAQLSIEFVEKGNPKVLEELSSCVFPLVVDEKSHVFIPPIPLTDFDDLNDAKETEKVLQATKLLFNYFRRGFGEEAQEVLSTFSRQTVIFSNSSKKYLFNLVKLVFFQLGASEESSLRLGQWDKLLHTMLEGIPESTISSPSEQQTIKPLLVSLSEYFDFSFENGRSFCQQILVGMLLALQKHRLNPSRRPQKALREEDIDQIKYVLSIAQISDDELTNANTWTKQLGSDAFKELEPLIISSLSANNLFDALGISYSVVLEQFTEDEKQSNLTKEFHAIVKEKFLEALANRAFDEVVKFSQWAGKPDGLEILLTELLSLFLDENKEKEKHLIEHLVKSSKSSEGIYRRIITLLFTVFKDKADFTQKMMDYLSLDAAIKLQQQLRSNNEGSDFKKFGRAIQKRTLEAYCLWTNTPSTICRLADSEDPTPNTSILEYIKSLILHSERTHGLNSAFYGFYELFSNAHYTETGVFVLDQAENLIKLVDSAAGLLLGEDRSLSLREPFLDIRRKDDGFSETTVPVHPIVLDEQLEKLKGDNAVLSFEELINMVLSVAELDGYMQNLLQQLFLNTADYLQQRFLEKCMEALETIDGDVRENIIFALLYTQRIELQKQFDFNDRYIYILTERPLNLNSYKNCFLLIKSLHQLLFINPNGNVEDLILPRAKNLLPVQVASAEGVLIPGTDPDTAVFQMISGFNGLRFRSEILTMIRANVKTLTIEQRALLSRLAVFFDKILLILHLVPDCPSLLKQLDWLKIMKTQRLQQLSQFTDSISFIDFISQIDQISQAYYVITNPRESFNRTININSGSSSLWQFDIWSNLLSYLNSRQVFIIETNPQDDKLHLITNPFKYRIMVNGLHNKGTSVFHYPIFTGDKTGLLPARQEIQDCRKNRPVQEIKGFELKDDSDNNYFSNTEDFLASPEAEIGLLKNLIEVINRQKKLESLETKIKEAAGLRGNPIHPITLFKSLFESILDLISDKDKIIKPLLDGIIKDVRVLGRHTSPEEVAWYWTEYVFKPFIDQKHFCQVIFQKLLSWMLFNSQRLDDKYIQVILELGIAAGAEPLNLLQIFDSNEGLRQRLPNLEFEIAREAYTSKMRLGQPIDLASFIHNKFTSENLSAVEFFTEVYQVSHNARSVIACILSKLGFNTSERYISVKNVISIARNLIEYLKKQIVPLDLALALIALLERLPQQTGADNNDDHLAISCEDELVPDKDCIATALCRIYPSFLVKDTKDVGDEVKHLDRDRIKRYVRELPTTMARCLENYLYDQFKPDIDEKCLEPVNPAWRFALNKYSLLVQLVEFFNKEIMYGASLIGDLELMFSTLKKIFGISVFDHPNLISKLADKDQNEQENIKIQYFRSLKEFFVNNEDLSFRVISSTPYQDMCELIQKPFNFVTIELGRLFEVGGKINQKLSSSLPLQMSELGRIKIAYAKHDNGIFEIIALPKNQAIQMLLRLCQQQMEKLVGVIDKFIYYLLHMGLRLDSVRKDLQISYKKVPRPFLQRMKGEKEIEMLPREAIIPEDRPLRIRYENYANKHPEDAKMIFGLKTFQQLLNPESDNLIMGDEKELPPPGRKSSSPWLFFGNGKKEEAGDGEEKQRLLPPESPSLTQTKIKIAEEDEEETNAMLDRVAECLSLSAKAREDAEKYRLGTGLPEATPLLANSFLNPQPRASSPVRSEASNLQGNDDNELNTLLGMGQGGTEENGEDYGSTNSNYEF